MARIPSQASFRSQMRRIESQMKSDIRKAERQLDRDLSAAQKKVDADMRREATKWERDANRKLRAAARPTVTYTTTEHRYLDPIREQVAEQVTRQPDLRDIFLCHAWADREHAALELHDHLASFGIDVWFSEKDVVLGTSLIREIDRGLANSKVGVVLVTPALLESLSNEGVADKELSALLATERVIPVVHDTTFDVLRNHSPLLASRSGLSTEQSTLRDVAVKLADTVNPDA